MIWSTLCNGRLLTRLWLDLDEAGTSWWANLFARAAASADQAESELGPVAAHHTERIGATGN